MATPMAAMATALAAAVLAAVVVTVLAVRVVGISSVMAVEASHLAVVAAMWLPRAAVRLRLLEHPHASLSIPDDSSASVLLRF